MGFGLLLIGYFTASIMALNSFGGVFRLVGYFIACRGAKKLSQYNRSFLFLLGVSVISVIFSVFCALSDVSVFLYNNLLIPSPLLGEQITSSLPYLKIIFDFVFVAVMCYSVLSISRETGAAKTSYTPIRNFIFYCIFGLLQFLVWLGSYTGNKGLLDFIANTALPIWMVIINIVCILLNCVMLFSCYARICDEGDVDMPQKPSRFAFINKRRAEKEEKRQKYLAEAEQYVKKDSSAYSPEQQARAEAAERAKKKNRHK